MHMRNKSLFLTVFAILLPLCLQSMFAQQLKSLKELQQEFVDLRFGMFIHFNIPTFMTDDWADPEATPAIFNPTKLDCNQWAAAAKSAKMRYGCLTTKHHSGFCLWNTKTTDYNVMNSPLHRDVVKEYTEAFRNAGLKTMLYFSILDTHHRLRPGFVNRSHIEFVKAQLTELLTNYGEITALIIDGWDAPWSRISYEQIPFEEIYHLVKRLQPNCLLMDLNAAKYPKEALFYTDIKSYEQNAGQKISRESNRLPALSCLPINAMWFWKDTFPTAKVKDPKFIVYDNIEPFNKAFCNFILNVSPNREGLIDANALADLREIGKLWKDNDNPSIILPDSDAPIIAENIAKHRPANSSWSYDMQIMDFGNDDDFTTTWVSNTIVQEPWYEVELDRTRPFNMVTIADPEASILSYKLLCRSDGVWKEILTANNDCKVKIHRFDTKWGDRVKLVITKFRQQASLSEFGVYNEQR